MPRVVTCVNPFCACTIMGAMRRSRDLLRKKSGGAQNLEAASRGEQPKGPPADEDLGFKLPQQKQTIDSVAAAVHASEIAAAELLLAEVRRQPGIQSDE